MDLATTRNTLRDDIEHNRMGRLSPGQIRALTGKGGSDLREDLVYSHVVHANGAIQLKTKRFSTASMLCVGIVQSTTVSFSVRPGLDVLPGPYRLYYLPRSRLVVSVEVPPEWGLNIDYRHSFELSDPVPITGTHLKHFQALVASLQGIEEDDFISLRAGRVPPSLKRAIIRKALNAAGYWLTWGAVFAGASVAFFMCASAKDRTSADDRLFTAIIMTSMAMVPFVITAAAFLLSGIARASCSSVRSWTGILREKENGMSDDTVQVGNEEAHMKDPRVLRLLPLGLTYRVYVASRGTTVMAIEVVAP